MGKIDIHVHIIKKRGIERPGVGGTYATPGELRRIYDAWGIDKGVNLPGASPDGTHYIITNEHAMELADTHPETLYWFCNIDPRMGGNAPESDLGYFLDYYTARGAKGVGEVTANLPFDDPRVFNLFKHAEARNLPVTFHIGYPKADYGLIDALGLPGLEKALQTFPKLRFMGHSQKFWAEISGDVDEVSRNGYPSGRVVPGGAVVRLMRTYPNLCGDMSAGSGFNAMRRDPGFAYEFLEEFKDRMYFGTDICDPRNFYNENLWLAPWLDEAVAAGRISQDTYERVCFKNALELLEG